MNRERAHWWVGVLTLVMFPLTAYMLGVAHVPELGDAARLVFRSRHLFLMVSGVANLAMASAGKGGFACRAASVLILAEPFMLAAAFFLDPARGLHSSQLFRFAMYGMLGAGILF
jgi:hypothetical protein